MAQVLQGSYKMPVLISLEAHNHESDTLSFLFYLQRSSRHIYFATSRVEFYVT